jgi:chorismate synthase
MSGNSFGNLFKITTCGESHGGAVGVIVDGCPAGLEISEAEIQAELDRRKPGQSAITTPRSEADVIHILSGVFEGRTTGTPILLLAYNQDQRSQDYNHLKGVFRPSHADYTYFAKYGFRDYRGSGRASARETLARVAAGAIAKKYLKQKLGIEILSYVDQVGPIKADINYQSVELADVEQNIIRCPDNVIAQDMIKLVEEVRDDGDSIGGTITCVIRNIPAGLGEPVFDRLQADLAKAMLSINATKGFEIGSGFDGVTKRGSEHNDPFVLDENHNIKAKTNNAGGVLGGISSGEDVYFRVAFKSVSTISKKQQTVNMDLDVVELEAYGRHDPCVLPRAVPVVDAMTALVVLDHYMINRAYDHNNLG